MQYFTLKEKRFLLSQPLSVLYILIIPLKSFLINISNKNKTQNKPLIIFSSLVDYSRLKSYTINKF